MDKIEILTVFLIIFHPRINRIIFTPLQKTIFGKYEKKITIALLIVTVQGVWAQTDFGNVPDSVNASDATITKMGHLTMTEARATMILQSGVVCASMTNVSGNEDFDYGGEGNDKEPQAHINFNVWEEEEDNKTNSDREAMFNKEAFLSVLR